MQGFFSNRQNWEPPPPDPQGGVCTPPPPGFQGRYTRLRDREWGVPIRRGRETLWYSRYISTLCSNRSKESNDFEQRRNSLLLPRKVVYAESPYFRSGSDQPKGFRAGFGSTTLIASTGYNFIIFPQSRAVHTVCRDLTTYIFI